MELLAELYSIHSPTGSECGMISFIRKYLADYVPEATCEMDGWGNLYITKGNPVSSSSPSDAPGYPTLACHMDQVQTVHSPDFEVRRDGDMLFGWSKSNQRREGLGADDKNGIWICLHCLRAFPCLKVFMSVGEEKGCIGSNRARMAFFRDSFYVIEPDSKEAGEVKVVLRGIPCASEEFISALKAEEHGFEIVDGKTTDILPLTLNSIGVSCANVSAGYYSPHKDDEYTLIPDLLKSKAYIENVLDSLHRRFPHQCKTETQKRIEQVLNEERRITI